jgi:hypothetical protein
LFVPESEKVYPESIQAFRKLPTDPEASEMFPVTRIEDTSD